MRRRSIRYPGWFLNFRLRSLSVGMSSGGVGAAGPSFHGTRENRPPSREVVP
jgi:hypothetical protein